jgi:prolipoprotein diacylglyceryl transferase
MSIIYIDPSKDIFTIPYLNWPITWYGLLFALGFFIGYYILLSFLKRYLKHTDEAVSDAAKIADRITIYVIIATILGARLGHLIFYEKPGYYLLHPQNIFNVWENGHFSGIQGLASHGAAIAIILAMILLWYRLKKKFNFLTLLDFICLPTALAAVFIRIGNFINQEILGTPSTLPWAVIFANPADGGAVIPRHPVQLYESFFYAIVFIVLLVVSYKPKVYLKSGRMIGLFMILVFGFRYFIEFFKEEQSFILTSTFFTMGQLLSIPFVILGLYFLCCKKKIGEK